MKLNLGSGAREKSLAGFLNLDIDGGNSVFPLPFPDESADVIRAAHVLEHFPIGRAEEVLREWARVLKPGGVLQVAVPDFRWIAETYLGLRTPPEGASVPVTSYVVGGQEDEHDYHKAIFDEASLTEYLTAAGLVDVRAWESEIQDCASLPVSLNLQATKPVPERIRIAAVMSVPRLGFTDTQQAVTDAVQYFNAPLFMAQGVWWNHALSRGIEKALEWTDGAGRGADYILTIDYDSIFTHREVAQLGCLMHDHPEADVIVPMQQKREGGELLAGSNGPVDLTQPLAPISQGHFGLTMFRRSAFTKLERPWFRERPDSGGGWGDGRVDADIGLWMNAEQSGLKVFLATQVLVGHLEMVVTWPRIAGGTVEGVYQPMSRWQKTHKNPFE